jgi:hypothetical protein
VAAGQQPSDPRTRHLVAASPMPHGRRGSAVYEDRCRLAC